MEKEGKGEGERGFLVIREGRRFEGLFALSFFFPLKVKSRHSHPLLSQLIFTSMKQSILSYRCAKEKEREREKYLGSLYLS